MDGALAVRRIRLGAADVDALAAVGVGDREDDPPVLTCRTIRSGGRDSRCLMRSGVSAALVSKPDARSRSPSRFASGRTTAKQPTSTTTRPSRAIAVRVMLAPDGGSRERGRAQHRLSASRWQLIRRRIAVLFVARSPGGIPPPIADTVRR